MALPATDDFNRANGPLGSNWTGSVGGDLAITSNYVSGAAGQDSSMYWSADAPDADHYAQCKLLNQGIGIFRGPLCRVSATDWVALDAVEQSRWDIEWYNGGSWTVIGSSYNVAPATNDIAKITTEGTTFKAFINGTERISGSNGSAPSSGYGGLYIYSNSSSLDDFEVGNLGAGGPVVPLFTMHLEQMRRN